MTPEQEKIVSEFNRCTALVHKCLTLSGGGQGAEAAYSSAYSAMVRVGLAQPLRKKYRR